MQAYMFFSNSCLRQLSTMLVIHREPKTLGLVSV